MKNGTGSSDSNIPRLARINLTQPLGRLRVAYTDACGIASSRLDSTTAGTFVITGGIIRDIHLYGDDDDPRATFTLVGPAGESGLIAVGTDAYFDAFGDIANGAHVEVRGTVVKPFRDGPAHVQLLSLYTA